MKNELDGKELVWVSKSMTALCIYVSAWSLAPPWRMVTSPSVSEEPLLIGIRKRPQMWGGQILGSICMSSASHQDRGISPTFHLEACESNLVPCLGSMGRYELGLLKMQCWDVGPDVVDTARNSSLAHSARVPPQLHWPSLPPIPH